MGEVSKIEWTGRKLGALKTAAVRVGLSLHDYLSKISNGLKWCHGCRAWRPVENFGKDRTRGDGLSARCLRHRRVETKQPRKAGINPVTGRPGPAPKLAESGNKLQARQRINIEVRTGRRSSPNDLPCVDCGHLYREGERRHEYDHHLGYDAEHHYDVESVCSTCHRARTTSRGELVQARGARGRYVTKVPDAVKDSAQKGGV